MTFFGRIYRIGPNLPVSKCNTVFQGRMNWLKYLQLQICEHTRKSVEEKLGVPKPKRPLNPFFKFMKQIRPGLNAKIPGISSKEAVVWTSKHWQQLDHETKFELKMEYIKDLEAFNESLAIYKASLTDKQKDDIEKMNNKVTASRKKRKLKQELKELGKPKKPISSYILYALSSNVAFQQNQLKEYQKEIREGWLKLSETEKAKFNTQAQELMKKYRKDLEAWELKMISMGHTHLVRKKPHKQKKLKNDKSVTK